MIALVIDTAWRRYRSHSPYFNFFATSYPEVRVFEVEGDARIAEPEKFEEILTCDAIVTSAGLEKHCATYSHGPRFSIGDDLHRFDAEGLAKLRDEIGCCDYYLTAYSLTRTQTDYPYFYLTGWERMKKLIFFPKSAPITERAPQPVQRRSRQAGVSGRVDSVYPIRQQMLEYGGDLVHRIEFDSRIREDYFRELSEWPVGLACILWLDSIVAKYFEIHFARSLLVAPLPFDPLERELLGFRDQENMLAVGDFTGSASDPNNRFRQKLLTAFVLAESGVADEGHALILRRHTVASRLDYLVDLVNRVRAGTFKIDDQYDLFRAISDRAIESILPRRLQALGDCRAST